DGSRCAEPGPHRRPNAARPAGAGLAPGAERPVVSALPPPEPRNGAARSRRAAPDHMAAAPGDLPVHLGYRLRRQAQTRGTHVATARGPLARLPTAPPRNGNP